ncbi:MAG: HD domain-containing phosphohydrolase [Nitrospirota bacterium]
MVAGNIRFKFSLLIVTLLALTTLVFSFITVQRMNRHIENELLKRAVSLNRSTAALAAYSMLSRDLLGVDHIVSRVKMTNPDIAYVAVVGRDQRIVAHSSLEKRGQVYTAPNRGPVMRREGDGTLVYGVSGSSESLLDVVTPVAFNGKQIGAVVTCIDKSALRQTRADVHQKIAAGLAAALLLGVIGIFFLSSFITRPIKELASGVEELKTGAGAKPLRVYSQDELGRLTENFNEMAALITEQKARLGAYAEDLEEAYVSTIKVLAAAIDARDPYTHGHSTRVARLAVKMGAALGLQQEELEDLEIAALLHDIGKLKTPDDILLKKGEHSEEEYREMLRHPEDGVDILSRAPSLHKYIPAVRHHHEWYSGSGYPDRLRGKEIPRSAALIAVADAFDAMTSTRPYRNRFSKEYAVEEIALQAGKQFDPELVRIFLRVIDAIEAPFEQPLAVRGLYD